jgi:hypothetical protein
VYRKGWVRVSEALIINLYCIQAGRIFEAEEAEAEVFLG